jgi:hypothetical protein
MSVQVTPQHVGRDALDEALASLNLGDAESEIRRRVRAVVETEVAPRAQAVDAASSFPADSYQALAKAGLAGLSMPVELGGSGHSMVAYCVAMEEIAAACGATSTVYMTQMHCAHPILLQGTKIQHDLYIPGLCNGSLYGSLAVTEAGAGSDVAAMRTVARRDGDDYVLNGNKTFITTGDRADVIVLFASVDRDRGRHGITAFLVPRGAAGLSTGRVLGKLGLRGSSTAELFLDDCRIPASSRLGDEGSGYDLSIRSVVKSRMSAAAQGVGFARAAYQAAALWAANHGLLSGSRRDAQDAQFLLADLRTEVLAARQVLYATADLVDKAKTDPVTEVAMCKLRCTDVGVDVSFRAMDLLGADGDLVELGVERIARDARATQIYDGTNQVQRLLIARDIRLRLEERPSQ